VDVAVEHRVVLGAVGVAWISVPAAGLADRLPGGVSTKLRRMAMTSGSSTSRPK
jgi:hypothetical protein